MSAKRILTAVLGFWVGTAVAAQPVRPAHVKPEPRLSKLELLDGRPQLAKASSHLLRARLLTQDGRSAAELRRLVPLVRHKGGLADVEIRLEELSPPLLEQMRAIGVQVGYASFRWARINGLLDLKRLEHVAAIPQVSTIHPNYGYVTWGTACGGGTGGSVCSQGDATINADGARSMFGVDGSGVTVGLMSDSFNDGRGGTVSGGVCTCDTPSSSCATVVTGMTNQTLGDLPASVPLLDDCSAGSPACDSLTDEGAALGEIVHDLAPGADLAFHSAANGIADFADGITQLANCGADVIVDDVQYFAEPMFQDGIIAQAAEGAIEENVAYFSSAGNSATFGIDDDFADSAGVDDTDPFPSGDDLHDFSPGAGRGGVQSFARITIPDSPDPMCGPGEEEHCCGILAVLQWSEPFDGGASGAGLGPGAFDDLDLYVFDSPSVGGGVLDSSTSLQGCSTGAVPDGDPLEIVTAFNTTGAPLDTFLAIENFCGDQDQRLRVATFALGPCPGFTSPTGDWEFEDGIDQATGMPAAGETPIFVDAQIYGHTAAEGVSSVAASFFREVDTGGAIEPPGPPQIDVEPFSSLGGDLPFFYAGDGTPLFSPDGDPSRGPTEPETRFKPEITAPDGTNNTFFGLDIDDLLEPPGDMDPNFFGTSASVPHAAALAALMQDLGNLTPGGLKQIIEQSVVDLEFSGADELSGFGLIDAIAGVGTTVPSETNCFIDDLELTGTPNTGTQSFRACDSLKVSDGVFDNIQAEADLIIFADGFESGDTSAWGN